MTLISREVITNFELISVLGKELHNTVNHAERIDPIWI
jgi:hypothetical protein